MNTWNDIAKKLTFREDDLVYLMPCLDITLYWSGSPFGRSDGLREGIVAFYNRCIETIGGDFKLYRTETMTRDRPIKKDTFGLVPLWFQGTSTRRDIYSLLLESATKPEESSDRAFALEVCPLNGFIRLVLPLSFIDDSTEKFLDLAKELGQILPFDFGLAGVSMNWRSSGDYDLQAVQTMHLLAKRYPGLELSDPAGTAYIVSKGIKCVNWLTFLNVASCERLGGVSTLMQAFDQNVVVHTLDQHGAIIQAGPAPVLGDVNRQESLPLYHQVGKVLAPIRSQEHPRIFGPDGIPDDDATNEWLARFDS